MIFASVADDNDPAKAILDEYVTHDKQLFRLGACMGLGLAYAGSKKKDVGDRLLEALVDPKSTMEVIGVTAIALGQIFVGTCDGDYTEVKRRRTCQPLALTIALIITFSIACSTCSLAA